MANSPLALNQIFRALADPTRRAILERLCKRPASVSDVAEPFNMSIAAVLQHIQVLEGSGLVLTRKIGRVRICTANNKGLEAAEGWLVQRRYSLERAAQKPARNSRRDID